MTTKTRTTLVEAANPLPPVGDELASLRSQHEQEVQAAAALVGQLHHAQGALTALAKRLQTAEHRREAEIARTAADLATGKAVAEADLATAAAERDRLSAGLAEAAQSLRALAAAAAQVADPLLPLIDGDDPAAWEERRDRVAKTAERAIAAGDTAAVGQAAATVKDLIDLVAARARTQSNRVQLLRAHVDELEADATAREQEEAALKATLDATKADLGRTRSDLDETRRTAGVLGEDLDLHKQKLARTTTASLEKEAQLLREREQLEQAIAAARARAEESAAKVRDLTGLLRKAERCGTDLARVFVDLAEADHEAALSDRLPPLGAARDELAELSRDAANSMDDEVDGLFRQDIGEDLVAAARAAADAVVARRRALAEHLAAAEARTAEQARQVAGRDEQLGRAADQAKADSAERDRLQARLDAATHELEERTRELAERNREATGLKADLAKAAAQVQDLSARLDQAKAVRADLERTQGELGQARKDLEAALARANQIGGAVGQLARQLVELAGAADGSLAVAGLKAEGSVSRLTRTVTRLEGEAGKADPIATAKAATEVADKLTGRLAQLGSELARRGEALDAARKREGELEAKLAEAGKAASAQADQVRRLQEEVTNLQQQAKRGAAAAERLAAREQELAAATTELARLKEQARQAAAAAEEFRARVEDTAATQAREVADLRRRLADEQKARRSIEGSAAERAETAEAQLTSLRAKVEQLNTGIEERDELLAGARAAQDQSVQARAHAAELQQKVDTLGRELSAANDRARRLETEAAARPAGASSDDLAAARAERDAALAKLRTLERKHADESAAAASHRTTADGLRRKLDERDAAHRAEVAALQERLDASTDEARRLKEKLAGAQAKVRTLTNL